MSLYFPLATLPLPRGERREKWFACILIGKHADTGRLLCFYTATACWPLWLWPLGWAAPLACGVLAAHSRIKPVSPALEAGFVTTGPPGNSQSAGVCAEAFIPFLRPLQPGSLPSHCPRPSFLKLTDHFHVAASPGRPGLSRLCLTPPSFFPGFSEATCSLVSPSLLWLLRLSFLCGRSPFIALSPFLVPLQAFLPRVHTVSYYVHASDSDFHLQLGPSL